ncbi:hypothetical protein GLW03_07505 [Halobacillus halophilus]|uniref:hypothetical protein n=1 Tax=Halobacillus halophilus TaxID=1570 RepID=UPI001370704E|nr:hypothetical protein [Halobacillus halophilus]MYL29665.1 hypothetical protein [Halobacillus halophilus]
MKKVIYAMVLLAISFISYIGYTHTAYTIEAGEKDVQQNIKEWLNRKSGDVDPEMITIVQLDDTTSYAALFETQQHDLGHAHLIKGWNGKYKIDHSGYGSNTVSYEEVKTNQGTYAILTGKNSDLKIEYVKAESMNKDYIFSADVSSDERFVRYEKLPANVDHTFPAEVTLYDKNHEVIR